MTTSNDLFIVEVDGDQVDAVLAQPVYASGSSVMRSSLLLIQVHIEVFEVYLNFMTLQFGLDRFQYIFSGHEILKKPLEGFGLEGFSRRQHTQSLLLKRLDLFQ